jgi:N-hydroxyarylamine O-acetyltransferase
MRPDLTAAYLARLGVDGPQPPTPVTLTRLHRAHLERVPFENLDIHLGVPIELDEVAFAEKIAGRSRGGFCYELNGAFASLLGELGFEVELLEARVYSPRGLGRGFDHLCLRVHSGEGVWLVDAGFGRGCFDEPINLVPEVAQVDTAGTFVLRPGPDGSLDLLCDGVEQYRLTPASRALADFESGCRYHQSSPDSPFTRGTVCTIRTPDGRVTLAGTRLVETGAMGKEERELDRMAFAAVLAGRFGIRLDDAAIARLAALGASAVATAL